MYEEDEEISAQSQAFRGSGFLSPMQQYGSSILELTNPEKELNTLVLRLRSQVENEEGNLVTTGDPLMNEEGICSIMKSLGAVVNRNTVMSNFDDKHVKSIHTYFCRQLAKDLMVNKERYGIQDDAIRNMIYADCTELVFCTLRRSFEFGEKKFWKGSTQEIHSTVQGQNQKKGFLSSLNPWSK